MKGEIGVSRGWTKLDCKANEWFTYPGVQYILSIRLSPALQVHQYRLDSVMNGAFEEDPRTPIADIVNPTLVVLDSHRLLGRLAHAPLPAGSVPTVTIDLLQDTIVSLICV
jgi:hypothetical protein